MNDRAEWTCACGHSGNKGKFCVACGKPRPAEAPAAAPAPQGDGQAAPVIPKTVVRRRTVAQEPLAEPIQPVNTPQAQANDTEDNKNMQVILITVMVILLAVGGYFVLKDEGSKSSVPAGSVATQSKDAAGAKREMQTDLSLGGMDIGLSLEDMHKVLGKENEAKDMDTPGYKRYYYNDIWVVVHDGKVSALESNSDKVKTKRGIAQGSKISAVFDAYGTDYMLSNYGGKNLYEYNFQSLDGRQGILRFAVNEGSDTVAYITVRYAPVSKLAEAAPDPSGALTAMQAYHKAISNRQYQDAYGMMTSDMQNAMGTFENYRNGYRSTLSSTVTDTKVLSADGNRVRIGYTLRARDRANGGRVLVQVFSGTAIMVNSNGRWYIDEMQASKQGEHYE